MVGPELPRDEQRSDLLVLLEGPCRTTKHFQKPHSFIRNINTFPEIVSSLFVSWEERLVGFVTSFFFFQNYF